MNARDLPPDDEVFSYERPDVLELLARMVVAGGYRMPTEGVSSRTTLTSADVAGAAGLMRNRAARDVALSLVIAAQPTLSKLVARVWRAVASDVRESHPPLLDLKKPANRYRLRIVVYDAIVDMVWPERRRPWDDQARAAKMRKDTYKAAHHIATSVLNGARSDANAELGYRLFGE